LKINEAHQR